MTPRFRPALAALVLVLAGCAGEPARLAIPSQTSEMSARAAARTVMIAEVSLPDYAGSDDIAVQTEAGLIELVGDVIWADAPEEAMTAALVRNLSAITGASVAAAPWPLAGFPDAELTVRVEQMLVGADGILRLTGQFAVRRDDGRGGALRPFQIGVPVQPGSLGDVARAHDTAWRLLAEEIAPRL